MIKIPTVEELLAAGAHFGHRASKWHPKMEPYIFGKRKGIHVIDLEKTVVALEKVADIIQTNTAKGQAILLIGTKDQVKNQIKDLAVELNWPYVSERWLGGLLTNFAIIRNTIKKYRDLLERRALGKLGKYTKKERLHFDRDIAKLELAVGGVSNLNRVPDWAFIWDIKREQTAMAEARKKGLKIIAVCDTNVNPDGVDFIIPANDDASKTVKLILEVIRQAALMGMKQAETKVEA